MTNRIVRGAVKVVAIVAGTIFFFDNRLSGNAGIVLLGSILVFGFCLFAWLIFGLGDGEQGPGSADAPAKSGFR